MRRELCHSASADNYTAHPLAARGAEAGRSSCYDKQAKYTLHRTQRHMFMPCLLFDASARVCLERDASVHAQNRYQASVRDLQP